MGRPIRTLEDHLAFQVESGFDFIYLRANYEYAGCSPVVATGTPISWEHSIAPEHESIGTYQRGRSNTGRVSTSALAQSEQLTSLIFFERSTTAARPHYGSAASSRTWMLMGYEPSISLMMILIWWLMARRSAPSCAVMRRLIIARYVRGLVRMTVTECRPPLPSFLPGSAGGRTARVCLSSPHRRRLAVLDDLIPWALMPHRA
jgi:hypothetical protein